VQLIATEGSAEAIVLKQYEISLAEFFNVSQATVQLVGASHRESGVLIEAKIADGEKCERCWRVLTDVGEDRRWPNVCVRCSEALDAIGFQQVPGEES
jgi:isoleucyl-tRNA synthetase